MSVCNKKKFLTYDSHKRKSAFFTNLVPLSQTVHPHRSSCRPRWSPLQISWPGPPCHRSAGAHTRCLWPRTGPGTPWNSRRGLKTLLRWVIPGLKGGECLCTFLTSCRSPGRCLWSDRHTFSGWCSWCWGTEASLWPGPSGRSCEQNPWWTCLCCTFPWQHHQCLERHRSICSIHW